MPSVKDFKGTKKESHKSKEQIKLKDEQRDDLSSTDVATEPQKLNENFSSEEKNARPKNRRRPGQEELESEIQVVDVDSSIDQTSASATQESSSAGQNDTGSEAPKVEIQFYGSEVLRARFPKPFDVAESIATDWVNDGKFEGLPVGHPLLQFFAAKGLQKAKEVEKTVMNSPVTEKIAMKVFETGLKAQGTIQDLKSQVEEIRKKVKGGR